MASAPGEPPARSRPARCRTTADRRRPGRRKRSGPFRGRPEEGGGANQGGGDPPPSPPHSPIGGRPGRARRPRQPGNPHGTNILWGGTPETTDGRPTPDGTGGRGAVERPPKRPLPLPPPSLRATGATLRPPGAEETPPLPRKDRYTGGGMRLDLHTARRSAPSRLLPRGSRPTGEPTPARGAARGLSCGAALRGAPEQYGGRAPHDPPHDYCPLRGGRGGVQV